MKGATEFKPTQKDTPKKLETLNGEELMAKDLPKIPDVVEGIFPVGLTVFAGKPKMGKSWLVLATALASASGGYALGKVSVQAGEALYLALEDSERRLQERLAMSGEEIPKTLHLGIKLARMDAGGLDYLSDWLEQHPNARIVVIDTLARVRPRRVKGADVYEEDATVGSQLQALALRHNIALVVVHHLRKADAEDPFDAVSGSTGLTGAADAIAVLMRPRGTKEAVLHVTGRDIQEKSLALQFNPLDCTWSLVGEVEKSELNSEEKSNLDEAVAWLESQLSDGALPAKSLLRYAKAEGIKERTLKRAKQHLNVQSRRESTGNKGEGVWLWFLLTHPEVANTENVGTLAPVANLAINTDALATITTEPNDNVGTVAKPDDSATVPTSSATVPTDNNTGTVAKSLSLLEENEEETARSARMPINSKEDFAASLFKKVS
jgi:hypothetical protein